MVLLSERDGYFAALAAYQRNGDVDTRVTHFAEAAARASKVSEALAHDLEERTAQRGIERLARAEVLREVTGYRRNRVWAADELFDVLDSAQLAVGRDAAGARAGSTARFRSAPAGEPVAVAFVR